MYKYATVVHRLKTKRFKIHLLRDNSIPNWWKKRMNDLDISKTTRVKLSKEGITPVST